MQAERYAAVGIDCKFDSYGTNVRGQQPCMPPPCPHQPDSPRQPPCMLPLTAQPEWGDCLASLKQNLIAATCIAAMISTLGEAREKAA